MTNDDLLTVFHDSNTIALVFFTDRLPVMLPVLIKQAKVN